MTTLSEHQSNLRGRRSLWLPRGWRALRAGERGGVAALELALMLPLLILLLLGACDFGRFAHTQVAVASAARAGAEVACHNRPTPATRAQWEAEIRAAVREELAALSGFRPADVAVTIATAAEAGGNQRASIQVRYPFRTLVSWVGIPAQLTFRETVVVRIVP